LVYNHLTTVHVSDYDFVKEHGRYDLLHLSAKRARDLEQGAWPLIKDIEGHNSPTIALKEIEAGVITWEYMEDPDKFNKQEEEEEAENLTASDYWPINNEKETYDNNKS
jgi:DNA-directed RNA polymerase omega subunit